MKSNLRRRFAAAISAALLAGSLGIVLPAAVSAATDPGCGALGGNDGGGVCLVSVSSTPPAGGVIVNEPLHLLNGAHVHLTNALTLTVNATGLALEMDKGSSIEGHGKSITINVPTGDMVMHGTPPPANNLTDKCGYNYSGQAPAPLPSNALGAQITSMPAVLATTITINVGNILALPTPTGSFVMERCSVVAVNKATGSAGTIVINAGHDVDIDGLVLSESGLTGVGGTQPPGGGPITIRTSCELLVSATGVVSSKGRDPGADLVHLQGCDVIIDGLVQSTGPGHVVPNSPANHCDVRPHNTTVANPTGSDTGCIEVWAEELTISNTGEVNANVNSTGAGGAQGTSYIDLFAEKEIVVTGRTAATATFAVHADSLSGTDTTPNTITVLSHTSTITATGKAFSASATGNGSWGGRVDIEASQKVTLDTATVRAAGDFGGGGNTSPAPCAGGSGACGKGGQIIVRSWTDAISWASGVGDVRPDIGTAPPAGSIALTACTTITIGATFFNATPTQVTRLCVAGPPLPAYVEAAFVIDRVIWDRCDLVLPGSKAGLKFEDKGGPIAGAGPSYTYDGAATDPGLGTWTIQLLDTSNAVLDSEVTAADGSYSFPGLLPDTYKVCEVSKAGWTQSFPNLNAAKGPLTVPPAGETIITCPNGTLGYQFTITSGDNFVGNNFGNFQPQVVCPEAPTIIPTRSVDSRIAVGGINYHTVSAAYAAAKTSGVAERIGIYTPSTENIVIDAFTGPSMLITECIAAKQTGADPNLPVWTITTTTAGGGKPVTINGPSVIGGGSIGWLVEGNGNTIKAIRADGSGIGIKVTGNNNDINGFNDVGTKTPNSSHGIWVTGNNNKIKGNTVGDNGGIGVWLAGNGNSLQATEADNGSDGVKVTGTSNTLKQNISSGNGGFEFNLVAPAINGGSNKSNGSNVPGPACPTFPAAGTQC